MTLSRKQPGQPFGSAKNHANAGGSGTPVKAAIGKFVEYLRAVRNASEHTLRNYQSALDQFLAYLSPPESPAPLVHKIDHRIIREYLGYLHDQRLQKSSIARKLASLRSFFKFCAREGMIRDNPARLVATPKLPKRLPMVLSAEEMNDFLNKVATLEPAEPAAAYIKRSAGAQDSARLLIERRTPSICAFREVMEAGALMSYGINLVDVFRDAAAFVDQVAKGAKAGDVPMRGPSHFHTAFNLKTANALGLDIPPTLLARADEVIE